MSLKRIIARGGLLPKRNIVVVGASVGGVEALQRLVRHLPRDFPASVFVVLHLSPESPSLLANVLERAGPLVAVQPQDGDRIRERQIYVAPPDHHMLLEKGVVRVVRGPKENRHRPAIDPLFRSAARAYGSQVIGIVLTGALDDGTTGLLAVKRRHGVAIVQDPEDAFCPDMPRSAMRFVHGIDHVLPMADIPAKLVELVRENAPQVLKGVSLQLEEEVKIAEFDMATVNQDDHPGRPSPYACPECKGVLWETEDGDLLNFRCRVGHAYTAATLAAEQELALESALWAALRALEESASMSNRLADRSQLRRQLTLEERFREQAEGKKEQAKLLRHLLLESQKTVPEVQ